MDLRLKYGPNFSVVNGTHTFVVTNSKKKGSISVTPNNDEFEQITGVQFIFTRNGQPYGESKRSMELTRTIDFSNNPGTWGVEVVVWVSEEYDASGYLTQNRIRGRFDR